MPRSPIATAARGAVLGTGPRQSTAFQHSGQQSEDASNSNALAANANIIPNASTGIHLTTRQRDANRAQQYQRVREHYRARSSYWS